MCREIVRERHGVVALGIVRPEEQRDFASRCKIRHMLDCGIVKLAPAVRVMAKRGPEACAQGDVLQPHVSATHSFVSPRGQMRSTSTLVASEASGGS